MHLERTIALGLALAGTLAAAAPALAADEPPDVVAEMKAAGFSDAEITTAGAGGIVTRLLPQREDNAAFVTGVTRIAAPAEALADDVRTVEGLRRSRTLQIGLFETPPTIGDLRPLVLESQDLDDLHRCRVGDCDIQVGRHAMDAIRAVDWEARDARERAAQLTKEIFVAQVAAYLEHGSSGMAIYDNNVPPESVAAGFEQLLRDRPSLVRGDPAFYRYLLEFPDGVRPPHVDNFLYWSKEKLRRPVVSLVHVCLQRSGDGGQTRYVIAMKHIYDSHYFLAYSEFLTVLPGPPGTGFYLVRSVRVMIDPPRGWLRGLLLNRIKGAMREQLAGDLRLTKVRLESLPGARPQSQQ
jgi:hypothetical protein